MFFCCSLFVVAHFMPSFSVSSLVQSAKQQINCLQNWDYVLILSFIALSLPITMLNPVQAVLKSPLGVLCIIAVFVVLMMKKKPLLVFAAFLFMVVNQQRLFYFVQSGLSSTAVSTVSNADHNVQQVVHADQPEIEKAKVKSISFNSNLPIDINTLEEEMIKQVPLPVTVPFLTDAMDNNFQPMYESVGTASLVL